MRVWLDINVSLMLLVHSCLLRMCRVELSCGEEVREAKIEIIPRKRWRELHIVHLAWESLVIPQEELQDVAGGQNVCATLLALGLG